MNILSTLGFWLVLGAFPLEDPIFPPLAVAGGTVVAELHFVSGKIAGVKVLSGDEPFAESCRSALSSWDVGHEGDGNEIVIVHFRHPFLYHLSNSEEEMSFAAPGGPLPYPRRIVSPAYPPNALGQGSVVLRAEVTAEGRVSEVQVIKSLGILTESSIEAIRRWEFKPAEDKNGKKTSSHAYAIFMYRFPIISPPKPK